MGASLVAYSPQIIAKILWNHTHLVLQFESKISLPLNVATIWPYHITICPLKIIHCTSSISPLSYKKEYDVIVDFGVYEENTSEEFTKIKHKCDCQIHTVYLLAIKYKNSHQDRVQSKIVVLRNQQQQTFDPSRKYAPVLSQTQFCTLLLFSVKHK